MAARDEPAVPTYPLIGRNSEKQLTILLATGGGGASLGGRGGAAGHLPVLAFV